MKTKMTMIEWLVIIAIVSIVLAVAGPVIAKFTGIPYHYSSGERTGVVIKLSEKGLFWKTWEGQMNLGSVTSDGQTGTIVPTTWSFSVTDSRVIKELQKAAKDSVNITVHYEQPLVQKWKHGESGYLVTGTDLKEEQ